ncbi:MAG: hypothetical protein AAF827_18700 [Cyanobacteria bacterium P01_D01_bin.6]
MQKLVTIYLEREGYRLSGKRSPEQSHGVVQEHLQEYLDAGWTVTSMSGAGGGGGGAGNIGGCGWALVLLEKT